jgi:hypothetical protein
MAQYTIGQAEQALASLAVSDNDRRQFQAEIDEAKAAATQSAQREAERIADDVRTQRDGLLQDLCHVRDELARITSAGENGTLDREAYRIALNDLHRRHDNLVGALTEVERQTERVEAIEADPVAFGDALFAKFPGTRPDFSF